MLDAKVAYGQNIVEAETAYTELKKSDTTIKFFYIPETAIKETADTSGTMCFCSEEILRMFECADSEFEIKAGNKRKVSVSNVEKRKLK